MPIVIPTNCNIVLHGFPEEYPSVIHTRTPQLDKVWGKFQRKTMALFGSVSSDGIISPKHKDQAPLVDLYTNLSLIKANWWTVHSSPLVPFVKFLQEYEVDKKPCHLHVWTKDAKLTRDDCPTPVNNSDLLMIAWYQGALRLIQHNHDML